MNTEKQELELESPFGGLVAQNSAAMAAISQLFFTHGPLARYTHTRFFTSAPVIKHIDTSERATKTVIEMPIWGKGACIRLELCKSKLYGQEEEKWQAEGLVTLCFGNSKTLPENYKRVVNFNIKKSMASTFERILYSFERE